MPAAENRSPTCSVRRDDAPHAEEHDLSGQRSSFRTYRVPRGKERLLKYGFHGLGLGHGLSGRRLLLDGGVLCVTFDSISTCYERGSLADEGEATARVLYERSSVGPDEDGGRRAVGQRDIAVRVHRAGGCRIVVQYSAANRDSCRSGSRRRFRGGSRRRFRGGSRRRGSCRVNAGVSRVLDSFRFLRGARSMSLVGTVWVRAGTDATNTSASIAAINTGLFTRYLPLQS